MVGDLFWSQCGESTHYEAVYYFVHYKAVNRFKSLARSSVYLINLRYFLSSRLVSVCVRTLSSRGDVSVVSKIFEKSCDPFDTVDSAWKIELYDYP